MRRSLLSLLWLHSCSAFVVVQQQQLLRLPSSKFPLKVDSSTSEAVVSTTDDDRPPLGKPGTADIPCAWDELGFEFRPTKSFVRMTYKDGEWGKAELQSGVRCTTCCGFLLHNFFDTMRPSFLVRNRTFSSTLVPQLFITVNLVLRVSRHLLTKMDPSTSFDPTKTQRGMSYKFLANECVPPGRSSHFLCVCARNAIRMQSSCERTRMALLPTEKFMEACNMVVRDNIEYVPPYGSDGALYIRPLLFGSGPRIGLQPADEYTFLVLVIPVGNYYKGGLSSPVDAVVVEDFDRAAPRGVGNVKVAGNYAADLLPNMLSKERGFPISLYLDAASQSLVEEFSTSNFVGIDRTNGKFVTPKSRSVLPSITNKALMTLAEEEGLAVEQRDIPVEELETFDEVLAVGTAVVVTPVGSITRFDAKGNPKRYQFGNGEDIGEITLKLYQKVRDIQNGEVEDKYGWNVAVV